MAYYRRLIFDVEFGLEKSKIVMTSPSNGSGLLPLEGNDWPEYHLTTHGPFGMTHFPRHLHGIRHCLTHGRFVTLPPISSLSDDTIDI